MKKEARIVKRKNKWCVIGHRRDKSGKYRNFGCYDTKEEAKKRLGQIYMFKHKKATIINVMTNAYDTLEKKGIIHIADAIISCAESIALESPKSNIVLRLEKIVNLLNSKGETKVAEQIDFLIPEVLSIEECGEDDFQPRTKISADKVYNIVKNIYGKYIVGLIDESSFEYTKMKELKSMLKNGFSLAAPISLDEFPEDCDSWWEYFTKRKNG